MFITASTSIISICNEAASVRNAQRELQSGSLPSQLSELMLQSIEQPMKESMAR
jgi:hypothetical protein